MSDGTATARAIRRLVRLATRAEASGADRRVVAALSEWAPLEAVCAACPHPLATLKALQGAGALEEALEIDGRICAEIRVAPGSGLGPVMPERAEPPFVLAPGAALEPCADGAWRLSSPCAPGEARLRDARLLAGFAAAATGWRPETAEARALAEMLSAAGLLVSAPGPAAGPLAAHDLRVHALSRPGSAPRPVGALGRDAAGAPPLRRGTRPGRPLPRAAAEDAPEIQALLARRRSRRAAGGAVATETLGALLWIAARDLGPAPGGAAGFERTRRPWPGAGADGEIDLHVASAKGFARYDPVTHSLHPLPGPVTPLLEEAGGAMGVAGPPAALIVLSARFGRIAWNYGDASYALILKNAGAALQTLHLAATALGVASCILGAGNSRAFARASGADPLEEGPVGEIALTGMIGNEGDEA